MAVSNSSASLQNVWNKISIFCLNHDEPKPMKIIQNVEFIKTPFYACEEYGTHCANRLNLDDYQGIIFTLLEKIETAGPWSNLTNFSFSYKKSRQKIYVKVLFYSEKEIKLGIRNVTVLGV